MVNKKIENRIVYAALILVLTVLAALVIVTGIVSRRARQNEEIDTSSQLTVSNPGRDTAEHDPDVTRPTFGPSGGNETKAPETTAGTEPPSADVDAPSEPPAFMAPADGSVAKQHSETTLVYSMTMNDFRTHSGVDIVSYEGAEVRAAAAGVIADIWEDPLWGHCVSISHEGDAQSVYKNLSTESTEGLKSGIEVASGEIIGSVGDSALCEIADEPHLHFELKIGGVSVDPEDYITFAVDDVFAD